MSRMEPVLGIGVLVLFVLFVLRGHDRKMKALSGVVDEQWRRIERLEWQLIARADPDDPTDELPLHVRR